MCTGNRLRLKLEGEMQLKEQGCSLSAISCCWLLQSQSLWHLAAAAWGHMKWGAHMMFQSSQVDTHQILIFCPSAHGVPRSVLLCVESAGCGSWAELQGCLHRAGHRTACSVSLSVGMQVWCAVHSPTMLRSLCVCCASGNRQKLRLFTV